MRTAIVTCAGFALAGFGAGWAFHGDRPGVTKYVYRTVAAPAQPETVAKASAAFPAFPKPPVDTPTSLPDTTAPIPSPMVGDLPRLPVSSPSGPISPLSPEGPAAVAKPQTADINADEALARRIVLQSGGEVVSSADAKDSSGKVGRTLVAEAEPEAMARLQGVLRKALGDRAILSDAGTVGGSNAELRKAEDKLEVARKARDRARIDYLPEAPILRGFEDDYNKSQQAVLDLRRLTARRRLNVLIRPVVASS